MNAKLLGIVLVLLVATGSAFAEGGKERGDVGQGGIVQDQVRVVVPPAQWDSDNAVAKPPEPSADGSQPGLAIEVEDTFLPL
jgi:hypothetical protein